MIRRLTFSLLLLTVLVAQGGSSVCQVQCVESQMIASPGNPLAGHCHGMRLARATRQRVEMQGARPCASHICAADLAAVAQNSQVGRIKLALEPTPLSLNIVIASPAIRMTGTAHQPARSRLHSSAVDPLINSLRV